MQSLQNLIGKCPGWVQRLDQLAGEIERRQLELAELTEAQSNAKPSSIRSRGSCDSLKPTEEPQARLASAHEQDAVPSSSTVPNGDDAARPETSQANDFDAQADINRLKQEALNEAQAQVCAMIKVKRSDSVISHEGASSRYRTRDMVIVYYDSNVQLFFEDVVKFVSASRNLMRKAKMAAKVAHIKRMAELETPSDDELDTNPEADAGSIIPSTLDVDQPLEPDVLPNGDADEPMPVLPNPREVRRANGRPRYSRETYGTAALAASKGKDLPDVYDELDKGLEYVQAQCEKAAHQILRDGNCSEEVENIKRKLAETKQLAEQEVERIKVEDPDALKQLDEPPKPRTYRPMTLRRDKTANGASEPKELTVDLSAKLEVDNEIDEAIDVPPKLIYRSTRTMRP